MVFIILLDGWNCTNSGYYIIVFCRLRMNFFNLKLYYGVHMNRMCFSVFIRNTN